LDYRQAFDIDGLLTFADTEVERHHKAFSMEWEMPPWRKYPGGGRRALARLRDPAAGFARVVPVSLAQRGRGECRVPSAPAASCAKVVVGMHTSIHSEFTGNARHSRTQWFYGL
jgi:hypothetical protein